MTKKEMIKAGIKLVVGFGVNAIVTDAVAVTTPSAAIGVLKRMAIGVGSFALSAYISDKVVDYVGLRVDEIFSEIEKVAAERPKEDAV